jgi:hypothetical protein
MDGADDMTDLIRGLIAWMSALGKPHGRHRARSLPTIPTPTPPATLDAALPTHRSPYGLHGLLDGTATVAVRPYVTIYEQRHRQPAMASLGLNVSCRRRTHGTDVTW